MLGRFSFFANSDYAISFYITTLQSSSPIYMDMLIFDFLIYSIAVPSYAVLYLLQIYL